MKTKARAYGEVLLALARAEGDLDRVDNDLRFIVETVGKHLDLRETLADAQVSTEAKAGIIEKIFKGKVTPAAESFLLLLAGMGQIAELRAIAFEFTELLQAEEEQIIAEVTTAVRLDDKMLVKLSRRLAEIAGKEVKIRPRVDESILGGVIIRMDGKMLDGSVSSRLAELREQMIAGKTNG